MSGNNQSSNRVFGIFFSLVFLLIGTQLVFFSNIINVFFIIISIILLILGSINSKILNPFKKIWIKLGELLGLFISPLVMALIFFGIITPLSFFIRILGKDLLNLKYSNAKTYWIKKNKEPNTMKKQF